MRATLCKIRRGLLESAWEGAMNGKRGVVALDVGGTKIACGLFLDNGRLLHRATAPTPQDTTGGAVDRIVDMARGAVAAAPVDVVTAAVGIVVPGWVDRRNRTVWAPNITGWDHLALEELLSRRLEMPVILDSDRSGYVRGEAWLGVALGLQDVVFLAVGTGIGAGILSGGRIIHGARDLAGAVGWMALDPRFREEYAHAGCFESVASGSAVGRRVSARPAWKGFGAKELIELAGKGDPAAAGLVDEIAAFLGMGVANLVSTLNPEMVVLGGGLFQGGELLLGKVRDGFRRWAQPFAAEGVRIELSSLGDGAGLAGAARIALDNIQQPAPQPGGPILEGEESRCRQVNI
jgi:glucokinase